MTPIVSSPTERPPAQPLARPIAGPVAGILATGGIVLGVVSLVFYALHRITLSYPTELAGTVFLGNAVFIEVPSLAWLVGVLVALLGLGTAIGSFLMRPARKPLAAFATGVCSSAILFGAVLAV